MMVFFKRCEHLELGGFASVGVRTVHNLGLCTGTVVGAFFVVSLSFLRASVSVVIFSEAAVIYLTIIT